MNLRKNWLFKKKWVDSSPLFLFGFGLFLSIIFLPSFLPREIYNLLTPILYVATFTIVFSGWFEVKK